MSKIRVNHVYLHYLRPRPRLERGTYCLGGTFEVWHGSAGYRLTCRLAVVRIAVRGSK